LWANSTLENKVFFEPTEGFDRTSRDTVKTRLWANSTLENKVFFEPTEGFDRTSRNTNLIPAESASSTGRDDATGDKIELPEIWIKNRTGTVLSIARNSFHCIPTAG